ncbi:MAG: ATP-binding domain-containing protein, partial [Clostridia bacterium]|nr:ATP-binding domain-containing protein [Clostridia bacterium]
LYDLVNLENWDGFYYSFSIPQISKEFDLLKLGDEKVLNLELKSEYTSDEKLLKQLVRNNYYLSHLGKEIIEIVYVADKNILYQLKGTKLAEITVASVAEIINGIDNFYDDDIEVLFRPSQFLVSPINTPEKFICGNYFLTDHQEAIRNAIIEDRKSGSAAYAFYHVMGGAGTGKTLLIYDIAKSLAQTKNICVIHCAYLAEGHVYLNEHLNNVTIVSIKDLREINFEEFDGFVIDESHRLRDAQLCFICDKVKTLNKFCVFGADGEQCLSKTEAKDNISEKIYNLEGCKHYQLTNKIRTNPELADFIHLLRKITDPVRTKSFPNVKVIYADTYEYANDLIKKYSKKGYKYISYTQSAFYSHNIDKLLQSENTHKVVGQEFDNVLMVINESFEYLDDGRLGAYEHPVPDYLFAQLLYQGLTRVREKLIIIVLNNETLFKKLLGAIKNATKE